MSAIRDHLNVHAQALQLREQRNGVLASNIANAATPGFKARDIDFTTALNEAIGNSEMAVTNAGHIPVAGNGGNNMLYRDPTMTSLDGNTVELSVEQMEFAENTLRYQSSLEFLNSKIRGLHQAIRGE
ncbi:flagellar basal body rod protein FlgB [Thalassovita aquimarina]|uniref:Flagellar basal body rod protein FlgB n=1 Tax=Thalassovita aquimarina TaxID=2785917 RepID=A0ABS5HM66_9RHOB|nr:flagellar basal body rod protein FlgB [Thalassovita aquimarina]MBR9649648.1 flagellar basal body rod protein FlgB [Thalassovita aquimarina]